MLEVCLHGLAKMIRSGESPNQEQFESHVCLHNQNLRPKMPTASRAFDPCYI